jgi:hypothetical protein
MKSATSEPQVLHRPRAVGVMAEARPAGWGWAPYVVLTAALGVLLASIADALSRSGAGGGQPLFWIAILVVVLPAFARLASEGATRQERIALVLTIGLALYLVKVLLDPFAFAFADEYLHAYNADEIRRTGSLFAPNPILFASPRFPGLETVAAALGSISGIGTFGAGLILIGAARLVTVLALYLLLEAITHSPRVAGLGVAIYAITPNFLFFDAQFSYESLALPLAIAVLFAVIRWEQTEDGQLSAAWRSIALVLTASVVVTHHITSYILAGLLVLLLVLRLVLRPGSGKAWAWLPATWAVVACLVWLFLVAAETVSYLSPVLGSGLSAIGRTLSGESATRQLFSSTSYHAPPWERIVGIGSVLLTACAVPIGLATIWRRDRRNPYAVLAAIAAVAYVGIIFLRLIPAAWEIANRSSEFLGLGLALVLALTASSLWRAGRSGLVKRGAVLVSVAVIMVGNLIAGWPPPLRVSQPYRIRADGHTLEPPAVTAAAWTRAFLGARNRLAASSADARLELQLGEQVALTGTKPDINDMLRAEQLQPWVIRRLRKSRVEYVLVDRQRISFDSMRGAFFRPKDPPPTALFPAAVIDKFERGGADRLFDNGDIVVFDVRRLSGADAAS